MHFPPVFHKIASFVDKVTYIFSYSPQSKTSGAAQDHFERVKVLPSTKSPSKINASVTVGSTVALALFWGYFRPDHTLVSAASHLYDPAFCAGGALVFYTVTASYARGQGRKDAIEQPPKLAYQLATSLLPKSKQAESSNSSNDWAKKTSQSILENGNLALQKGRTTLRGAIVLLCEHGGSPEALLEGLGAAELTLIASDLGYIIPPNFAGVVIATSLAGAAALVQSSYGEEPIEVPNQKGSRDATSSTESSSSSSEPEPLSLVIREKEAGKEEEEKKED